MDNIAMSAARAWAAKAGCGLQYLHVYADADGNILFYRIRAIHNQTGEKWIRPMHKDASGQYVLRLPDALKGKPMPLYGLNRLSHAPDATTWLVEGEKCADLLNDFFAKDGGGTQHLAITSGGATSASKADWQPMAGRQVIIWPDNDEAGAQYAHEVLRIITGLGCEVKLLDTGQLGLDEKGDVVNWLAAHPYATPDDLLALPKQSTALSENHKNSGKLMMRCMADIAPEAITWLWPARIALGKITVIAGMPGLGKSQLTAMLAAHVTTGTPWPDGTALQHAGQALFLSAEDDAADTIVPRLMAAGADLAKCHTLDGFTDDNNQERCINLAENIPEIIKAIESHPDVRLVVIDPVSAYLGDTKSHDNASVRGLLAPLVKIGQERGVTFILVTHLNKTNGQDAISRFIGSIGMVAAARAAYIVTRQPEDEDTRLFLPVKNNLGNDRTGVSFTIESVKLANGIETSRIIWRNADIKIKADDVLNGNGSKPRHAHAREEAVDFLQDALQAGERSAGELMQEAKDASISRSALTRARKQLEVVTRKQGKGAWLWSLPKEEDAPNDFELS